jgi:hypothetical protein
METINNGFRGLETRVFLLSENRKTPKATAATCGAGQTLQCGISDSQSTLAASVRIPEAADKSAAEFLAKIIGTSASKW